MKDAAPPITAPACTASAAASVAVVTGGITGDVGLKVTVGKAAVVAVAITTLVDAGGVNVVDGTGVGLDKLVSGRAEKPVSPKSIATTATDTSEVIVSRPEAGVVAVNWPANSSFKNLAIWPRGRIAMV